MREATSREFQQRFSVSESVNLQENIKKRNKRGGSLLYSFIKAYGLSGTSHSHRWGESKSAVVDLHPFQDLFHPGVFPQMHSHIAAV